MSHFRVSSSTYTALSEIKGKFPYIFFIFWSNLVKSLSRNNHYDCLFYYQYEYNYHGSDYLPSVRVSSGGNPTVSDTRSKYFIIDSLLSLWFLKIPPCPTVAPCPTTSTTTTVFPITSSSPVQSSTIAAALNPDVEVSHHFVFFLPLVSYLPHFSLRMHNRFLVSLFSLISLCPKVWLKVESFLDRPLNARQSIKLLRLFLVMFMGLS